MSSQSVFGLFTAALAAFTPLVSAYTQPQGASPSGNPISSPGLNQVVPAGQPFTITWEPTTQGTVDLVLLKGPSENAVPQYAIAEAIPNSGSYVWTPSTDLVPTGNSGYGIELIVTSSGQYQYSTQFGISNDNAAPSSYSASTSSSASSSSSSAAPTTYAPIPTSVSSTSAETSSHGSSVSSVVSYSSCSTNSSASAAVPTSYTSSASNMVGATATGGNGTAAAPTASMKTSAYGNGTVPATGTGAMPGYTGPAAMGAGAAITTSFFGIALAAGAAIMAM